MSEEDRKLQKHLVNEMMKVSKTNPDVMFYMESLMKKYEELEQKVEQLEKEKDYLDDYNRHLHNENEQLENIRKEAIEYITKKWYSKNTEDITKMVSFGNWEIDLLNILNKGSEFNVKENNTNNN